MNRRRTALVTGAARGQGLAIVHELVSQDYCVVAGDVLTDALAEVTAAFSSERVLALPLDVTSAADWVAATTAAQATFGGLDALVNNAGIHHRTPFAEETAAVFEREWRVNCLGPFLGMQACLPLLREGNDPAVVNTVSTSGFHPYPNHVSYTSSKFGARGVSLAAAAELSQLGIRVNAVMPGPVATPMHSAETIERLSSAALLGRAGSADEIASVVAFLLSPGASFMTGAEVVADGGALLKIKG